MSFSRFIKTTLRFAAKPYILFYTLPWLMILLVLGTIAQKNMGVYEAQHMYFSSWFLFLGPIPLPGGFLTLALIFVTLLIKFIFYSEWSLKKSGIILTHLGVLILLLGGLITSKYAHETFMIIPEGDTISNLSEYRKRVITLEKEGDVLKTVNFDDIRTGPLFKSNMLPFNISAASFCNNCTMEFQNEERAKTAHGMAQKVELKAIPEEKEKEGNLSGAMIMIEGADQGVNGRHLLMESVSQEITILSEGNTSEGNTYTLKIGRVQTPLPFAVKLIDFRRTVYPGTNNPKGFESDIIIQDKGVEWPVTIRMNEPARYKGYTFYQSSFVQRPDLEITVLNVVHNIGHIFPYISSLIILLGLLLHSCIKLNHHKRRKT